MRQLYKLILVKSLLIGSIIFYLIPLNLKTLFMISTRLIRNYPTSQDPQQKLGKLFVSFSNSSKEEITKLDGTLRQDASKLELLRKFIMIKEEMAYENDIDYIIIDTSPGIRSGP